MIKKSYDWLSTLMRLVDSRLPNFLFYSPVRYRVVGKKADRYSLQVVERRVGLPDTIHMSLALGIPGADVELANGTVVLVQFIEGDRSMPVITHFRREWNDTWVPIEMELRAIKKLVLSAASQFISIDAMTQTITINANVRVNIGDGVLRPVALVGSMAGPYAITTGSTKVFAA